MENPQRMATTCDELARNRSSPGIDRGQGRGRLLNEENAQRTNISSTLTGNGRQKITQSPISLNNAFASEVGQPSVRGKATGRVLAWTGLRGPLVGVGDGLCVELDTLLYS